MNGFQIQRPPVDLSLIPITRDRKYHSNDMIMLFKFRCDTTATINIIVLVFKLS